MYGEGAVTMFGDFEDEQEELMVQLAEIDKELEVLVTENQMYENCYQVKAQADPSLNEDPKKKAAMRRKKNLPTTLTPEQKCEIANFTLEELQKEAEESKKRSEKLVDNLRAILEETDLRIAELKKEAYEFKRDIVVGAENMRTGKTVAEKIYRYMEDKLRQKDQVMEKLRLKNATLKAQIAKAEHQLNQKEEMGDILHYIDFHQLQIENKQYVVKIEDLNEELLKLKSTTGRTVKALARSKTELDRHVADSLALERDIASRAEQVRKVREENVSVVADMQQEKRARRRLSQDDSEASSVPQVLDYVAQKAEMYELQEALKNWKKKVSLMEYNARKAQRTLRQQTQQAQQTQMLLGADS